MNLQQKINVISRCYGLVFTGIAEDWRLVVRGIIAIMMVIGAIVLNLKIPLLFRDLVHNISLLEDSKSHVIISLAGIYGVCWMASQTIEQVREILLTRIFEKTTTKAILDYYLRMIFGSKSNQGIGNKITIMNLFQETFPNLMWGMSFLFIPMLIQTIAAALILANYCGYKYGLIFFVITAIFANITRWGIKKYILLQQTSIKCHTAFSSFLINRLVNIDSVFYYTTKAQEKKETSIYLQNIEDAETNAKNSMEFLRIFQGICIGTGLVMVTMLSAVAVFSLKGNLGDFVMVNAYVLQFTVPLSSLGVVLADIYRGFPCVESLLSHIKSQSRANSRVHVQTLLTMELANVSYIYENNNHPVVKDVSLAISVYEKIGFFGPSGSGKTTVSKLLLNRISPTDGSVYINGEHLEDLDIESLHRVLTIVPQQLELFQGTLHYNLTFGARQALEEEINHILSLTSLERVVSALPKGLHSDVGDFCKDFSGGERQRIGIAMALLRRPQFMILDESLSFVDKESAHKIINGLRDLPFLKGFILISHDLSLLSSLDKIVFFKNGEVQTITAPATLIPEKTMKVS